MTFALDLQGLGTQKAEEKHGIGFENLVDVIYACLLAHGERSHIEPARAALVPRRVVLPRNALVTAKWRFNSIVQYEFSRAVCLSTVTVNFENVVQRKS